MADKYIIEEAIPGCSCQKCRDLRKSYTLRQANELGIVDVARECTRLAGENERLNRQVEVLLNQARYLPAPPPIVVKQPPVEELLTTYDKFVKDMTLEQVKSMRDNMRGMVAEVGELNGKVYKADRDNNGYLDKQMCLLELGDILFYVTGVARELGFSLEEVIRANKAKLMARKLNGTLQGSGDKR